MTEFKESVDKLLHLGCTIEIKVSPLPTDNGAIQITISRVNETGSTLSVGKGVDMKEALNTAIQNAKTAGWLKEE